MDELINIIDNIDHMTYERKQYVKGILEKTLEDMQSKDEKGELSSEQRALLAKGLKALASIYRGDFMHPMDKDDEYAWETYMRSKLVFDKEYGKGNIESWNVVLRLAVIAIDNESHGDETIKLLQEQLDVNEKKADVDEKKVVDSYKRMSELASGCEGELEKAIEYYQPYLNWARKTYGEESDFVADCYDEIAMMCEDCDDMPKACEYTERALNINIREMGKMYLLPPVFKNVVVGVLKTMGKIDEDDKFNRIISASGSYCELARLYLEIDKLKQAKECIEKSIALYEMEIKVPTYEKGYRHEIFGDILSAFDDKENASHEYQTAQDCYKETILKDFKINKQNGETYKREEVDCKEALERMKLKFQGM